MGEAFHVVGAGSLPAIRLATSCFTVGSVRSTAGDRFSPQSNDSPVTLMAKRPRAVAEKVFGHRE